MRMTTSVEDLCCDEDLCGSCGVLNNLDIRIQSCCVLLLLRGELLGEKNARERKEQHIEDTLFVLKEKMSLQHSTAFLVSALPFCIV